MMIKSDNNRNSNCLRKSLRIHCVKPRDKPMQDNYLVIIIVVFEYITLDLI